MNTDLATLFAKDPHECTTEDIDVIIEAYRAQRQQFKLGVKEPKPAKAAKPKIVDLSELGL